MNDERKTKAQLMAELAEVRQRVIELEAAEAERARVPEKAPGVFEDAVLRASETRYRRLFETAQDGILLLDAASGKITDVNPFLEKLLGYSHAELIGQYLWEIGPFRDVAESKLAFEQLQTNEYIRYEDLPLETRDGRRVNVEFVSNVYRVNGVKVIQCNVRDITARQRAEEALAQNQHQFRTLMDNIPDHIYFKDTQSRFTGINKAMADWIGLADPAQALGKTDFDFFTQEHAQSAYADEQEVIRTGQPLIDLEEKETWPDHLHTWASTTKMPLYNSVGKIVGTFGVSRDITDRKRAEQRIESLARFPAENPNPVLRLRPDGVILYANEASQAILQDWGCAVGDDAPPVWRAVVAAAFAERSSRYVDVESVGRVWSLFVTPIAEAGYINLYGRDITDRKRAEAALRESEERYRTTLYSIGDSVITTDTKGCVWQMNPSAEKITSWREAEAKGKPIGDVFCIVNEDTRREVENPVARILREGMVIGLANHTLLIARDGAEYPVADSGAPIRNAQGEITGVVLVFRDQTAERAAEKTLRESEDKFKYVFDYSVVGKSITQFKGGMQVNKAFCDMLGYSFQEMQAKKWPEITHPDDIELTQNQIDLLVSGQQESARFVKRFIHKNGSVVWVDLSSTIRRDQQHMPLYLMSTVIDITERKQAEQALQQSEEKYRALFENAQVGMYRTKIDGSAILDVNQNLLDIFGYTREEMIASPSTMRWAHPEEREKMARRLRADGVVTNLEVAFITKTGETRDFLISVRVYPEQGILEGTGLDITERKRMEEALRRSEQRLRRFYESGLVGVIYWNMHGEITDANDKFLELVGYTRDDLVAGRIDWLNMTPPEYRPLDDVSVAELKATGVNRTPFEKEYIRKDGTRLPILVAGAMLDDARFDGVALVVDITERKRAEEVLRQSENTVRAWLNAIQESAFLMDREGIILAANATMAQRLGRSVEGLVGACIYDSLPPQTAHTRRLHVAEVIESGQPVRFEDERSGRFMDNLIYPVFDQFGQVKHMAILGTDITERKQAEVALWLKNSVFDASIAANSIADMNGTITEANVAFLRVWGYPGKNEVVGKPLPHFINDPNEAVAIVTALNNTGQWEGDYSAKKKDGSTFIAHGLATTVKDEKGKVVGYQSAVLDVTEQREAEKELKKHREHLEQLVAERTTQLQTANKRLESELAERKRAEEALRESEDRFRRLSEAAFEAIIIHEGGVLLSANDQYPAMFGYEPQELLGKQVMPLTIAPEAIESVGKEIATGGVGPYESIGLRKDGTKFPMEIRVREMEYEGRKVRVAAIMDITERKRAEEALQQRTTQLEAANKELEAFTYSVSHDLRAPLRAIDGYTRILLEDYAAAFDDEGRRIGHIVSDEARRMGKLIDDLLALSRLNRTEMRIAPIDMQALVHSIFNQLTTPEARARIDFRVDALPTAEGDAVLIQRVWENLLANALKFSGNRARAVIEVSGTATEEEVTYRVRDNGAGFDMQYAKKLFGVFQRLHSDKEFEGTGVGLAIVQRVVHRHGGRVWGEGQVDAGAAFYFTLPIHRSSND